MSKLPTATGKQLVRALGKVGFSETRTHGSHHFLRDAELTRDDLIALL